MQSQELFLSIFFVFLVIPSCKSRDAIKPNQSVWDGESISSKENNFELGFFSPSNSSKRFVGIWYSKLPGKTVVWVANRDNPINDTSGVLTIDSYGNLVLLAHNNSNIPIWSTNASIQASMTSSVAQLLDTGNLVLFQKNNKKEAIWESFHHPTDTMLPGMKLGLNRKTGLYWFLTSWKSENDPGIGNYSYRVDVSGCPQFFLYKGSTRYWRSAPWPWRNTPTTLNSSTLSYTYVDNQDEMYYYYNNPSRITRIVVSNSGSIQNLFWYDSDRQWKEVWSAPNYKCDQYGKCGAFSKCNPDNVSKFECTCLLGYEPKSPTKWNQRDGSDGCVRKNGGLPKCRNGEGFLKLASIKVPDTSGTKAWWREGMSYKDCEKACLNNCSCTAFLHAVTIDFRGCFTFFGELFDIVEYAEGGRDLYLRVDAKELAQNHMGKKGFLRKKHMQAVLLISLALIITITFALWWLKKKKNNKFTAKAIVADENVETTRDQDLQIFHLSTIAAATSSFSLDNKLGQGGFGSVYMGQLSDGQKIAVKRLSKTSGQGNDEFKNEVLLIAKLQHRNLVKLFGCCIEGEEKMLIYEYMPNKSLDSFLFDETRKSLLDWRKRFDIIVGIARGIMYLHQDSRLRIIHRDLKTSNILLDSEMNPKISDFGMARIFDGDEIQGKTNIIVGTYGYMAPEYAVFGKFSIKSDVFSFGVILLEIISGKKNSGNFHEDDYVNLIGHVWDLWSNERELEMVDSTLESYNSYEVLRCIQLGLLCVQEDVMERPTMSTVVLMLSSEVDLPAPKQPAYVFRRPFQDYETLNTGQGSYSSSKLTITEIVAR